MICENCAGIGARETELGMLCDECYTIFFNRQANPPEDEEKSEEEDI